MGLQGPTTANLAMGPIRAQNGSPLFKVYYKNNDFEARCLQRPTTANLTRAAIRRQNCPSLLKVYYLNNDLEARLLRLAMVNLVQVA